MLFRSGDIIGYGADPLPCLDMVYQRCSLTIAGNHDYAAVGLMSTERFNPFARRSAEWTSGQLRPDDVSFIQSLPLYAGQETLLAVHGTMDEPVKFNYMATHSAAQRNFNKLAAYAGSILVCGHTHNPIVFLDTAPMRYSTDDVVFLEEGVSAIANVGSVGQPRDGDPRSCYCIVDTEKRLIRYRRVEYDMDAARLKVEALFPDAKKDEPLPDAGEKQAPSPEAT